MSLRIRPVYLGRLCNFQLSAHQYLHNFGQQDYGYMFLWIVEGGETPIIVDTGPGTPALVRERLNRELEVAPEQEPGVALRRVGIDPDKVEVVVQTHLHWDHTGGLELGLFPNAEIYIQQSELQYAACPYPVHRFGYDPWLLKRLLPDWTNTVGKLKVINGDRRLIKGVDILHMPGHTPGLQALAVETEKGIYVIASDTVPTALNWQGWSQDSWIPSGVHVNLEDCYRSMERLSQIADYVFPSHDRSVLEHEVYPLDA